MIRIRFSGYFYRFRRIFLLASMRLTHKPKLSIIYEYFNLKKKNLRNLLNKGKITDYVGGGVWEGEEKERTLT